MVAYELSRGNPGARTNSYWRKRTMMFVSKKRLNRKIDELEEQLYLTYKKMNLTVLDARRQAHVFDSVRNLID